MMQARDYRKYNVRLTSADWQRGSGVGCSKTSQICNICVLAMPQGQICVVLARVVQNVCKRNANYRYCSDNAPMTQTAELAVYEVFVV